MPTDIEQIYLIFRENAFIHSETQMSGDYKTGNKAHTKIKKIYVALTQNNDLKNKFFELALKETDYKICLWVASFCLALDVDTPGAKARLAELAERKDIGILSLNAEYTIKEFDKKGFLKF